MNKMVVGVLLWLLAVTAAHLRWNVSWSEVLNDRLPPDQRKLMLAYIPVT